MSRCLRSDEIYREFVRIGVRLRQFVHVGRDLSLRTVHSSYSRNVPGPQSLTLRRLYTMDLDPAAIAVKANHKATFAVKEWHQVA